MLRCFNSALTLKQCITPFWGGFALNNVLPLRAGDIVRVAAYRDRLQIDRAHIASTLLVERVYDLLALLLALLVALLIFPAETLHEYVKTFVILPISVATFAILLILVFPKVLQTPLKLAHHLISDRPRLLIPIRPIETVISGLVEINQKGNSASLIISTIIAWILEGLAFSCVLLSLGIEPAIGAGWMTMAISTLSTLIPSSPGYAGTFDFFAARTLTLIGLEVSQATLAALLIHLVVWAPITLIGSILLWLTHGFGRFNRLKGSVHKNEFNAK